MPAALAVEWEQIRKASEQGVSDPELQERFGVSKNAIQQRRHREKWITPATLAQEALVQQARNKARGMGNQSLVRGVSEAPTAIEVIGDSLLKNGEQGSLLASNLALSLLQAANDNPNRLKPLSDIYDLTAGMKAVRMAAGMDKLASPNISVNLAMFASQTEEKQAWKVSEVVETQEGLGS